MDELEDIRKIICMPDRASKIAKIYKKSSGAHSCLVKKLSKKI